MPSSVQRRASPRCRAVQNQAHLELVTPRGRRRLAASLVNLSRDGALIVTGEVAPLGEPIWVRMDGPVRTDWVAAVPVRMGRRGEIAVRFPRGCPDDLLLAATLRVDLGPIITDLIPPCSRDDVAV